VREQSELRVEVRELLEELRVEIEESRDRVQRLEALQERGFRLLDVLEGGPGNHATVEAVSIWLTERLSDR
jgi:hypothetical protein